MAGLNTKHMVDIGTSFAGGFDDGYERDYYDRPPPPPRHYNRPSKPKDEDMEGFQPAMMSFKSFLQTQDDQISDEEAIKKYGEYKLEFKRQQLNEFFVTHKEEEWFKQKYHPDDSVKRKDELRDFLKKRVEVFQEFLESGKIEDLQMDCEAQDSLIRILDSVVIKLEGGTDFDLNSLDLPDEEEGAKKEKDRARRERSEPREERGKPEENSTLNKAKEMLDFLESPKKEESKKRKREDGDDEDVDEEGDKEKNTEEEKKDGEEKEDGEEKTDESQKTEVEKDLNDEMKVDDEEVKENKAEEEQEEQKGNDVDEKETKEVEQEEGDKSPKPRALHKTSSIFLRNLPPTVTKQEVEAMCRRYEGFLRSAIADPAPDRRWFRRGWVTYKRTVKIKDICYNLNNIRYCSLTLSVC